MSTPIFTIEQLQTGLQTLPQELYDQIFALTFTINAESVVINEHYKPPSQLQVCSRTRKNLMKSYYRNRSWQALGEYRNGQAGPSIMGPWVSAWLNSLSGDSWLALSHSNHNDQEYGELSYLSGRGKHCSFFVTHKRVVTGARPTLVKMHSFEPWPPVSEDE